MKEEIEKLYVDGVYNDVVPNVFAKQVLDLFNVSQQSEPFINFTKELIEYYEQHDIGDEDIYNKAKK